MVQLWHHHFAPKTHFYQLFNNSFESQKNFRASRLPIPITCLCLFFSIFVSLWMKIHLQVRLDKYLFNHTLLTMTIYRKATFFHKSTQTRKPNRNTQTKSWSSATSCQKTSKINIKYFYFHQNVQFQQVKFAVEWG